MKGKLFSISTTIILMFILVGCGGQQNDANSTIDEGITEITLWHMEEPPNRVRVINETIEKFNNANPEVNVTAQVQSWDDAYSQFPAAIQAGNGPDLLFTLPDYTTLIKKLGVVQPVDDIVESLDASHNFIGASLDPYQYEGHTWAVPMYGMVQALWYRQDIFEQANLEAPKTWDEFLHAAETLTQDGVHGIALPASRSLATDQVVYSFLITAGAKSLIDGDNNVTFNTPETVNAYSMYEKLLQFSPNDSNTYRWGEPQAQFNSGRAAMAIEKGQYLAPFEDESGETSDKLGIAPMPVAEGGEEGSIYYSTGIMMLTEDEEKQRAIKEFFTFLYEPENYSAFINAEPGLFLPVTESAIQSEEYWSHPVISKYEEQVRVLLEISENGALFGFTDGAASEVGKISGPNLLAQTLEQMMAGKSPEEAVEWGHNEMERAVQ